MQWFNKAAQQGYAPAATSLALGYLHGLGQGRQDYRQAAAWFEKAFQQDDDFAALNLGVMYQNGWGVPQNFLRAKQLYARAAGSSNTTVASLGKQYFADVPFAAPSAQAPRRTALSSSKDSSDVWKAVIVGALAVGVLAVLTSGGSRSGDDAGPGGYTPGSYNPGSLYSSPAPSTKSPSKPFESHYAVGVRIPMGNIYAPNVISTGSRWSR